MKSVFKGELATLFVELISAKAAQTFTIDDELIVHTLNHDNLDIEKMFLTYLHLLEDDSLWAGAANPEFMMNRSIFIRAK